MFALHVVLTMMVAASGAHDAPSQPPPEQTVRALAGTWTCTTEESGGRIWRSETTNVTYGPWLRMDDRFPAQNGQKAGTVVKFLGYDDRAKRWIVMSIDDSGGYYVMESASKTFDASHWADVYPADGVTGFVHVIDVDAYTFSSAVPDGHGHTDGSHTRCSRT